MRILRRLSAPALSFSVLGAAFLLLAQSTKANEAALSAVKLSATVLIPSLFPYMVISSLIVSLGATGFLERSLSPLCRRLFRLPGNGVSAIVLGALCGFPVGAHTACNIHKQNRLSKSETERLIAIANNTGPAFVIEVVGNHYWNSRGFGLALYVFQIFSAFLVSFVYARLTKSKLPTSDETVSLHPRGKKDLLSALANAITDGASSVLTVSGFVVFFSVALALLKNVLSMLGAENLFCIFASLTEFTAGTEYAAALGGATGAFFTGFSLGWSGLSVFSQCKVFTAPLAVRLTPALLSKGAQGILTGILAAFYVRYFLKPSLPAASIIPVTDTSSLLLIGEVILLLLFCLLPVFYDTKRPFKRNT